MPTKRETIFPEDIVEKLGEFEKLLTLPGYGKWRREKVLKRHDVTDLLPEERDWLCLLEYSHDNGKSVTNFIFGDLEGDAIEFRPSEKLFIKFLVRPIQKKPEYAKRVIEMFG